MSLIAGALQAYRTHLASSVSRNFARERNVSRANYQRCHHSPIPREAKGTDRHASLGGVSVSWAVTTESKNSILNIISSANHPHGARPQRSLRCGALNERAPPQPLEYWGLRGLTNYLRGTYGQLKRLFAARSPAHEQRGVCDQPASASHAAFDETSVARSHEAR